MEIRSFELTRAALFSVLVVFLLNTAESQTDPTNAQAMRDLAAAIDPAGLIGWDTSEDPCGWNFVSCGADGKVTALRLAGKSLTGTLPGSIRNLTALTTLELQRNAITGPLPSFAGMSSLQIAILHNNSFSSIPPDFFVGLTSLRGVNLDHNPFAAWSIPASLKDASSLVNFSANAANVTGEIPTFLGSEFPSLISVCLAYNSLSGVIPTSFADTLLQVLWLNNQQGTKLSGRIDVVSNMSQLVQVWLQSNAFTGPVPDLSNLKSLSELNLRDNALTGPVPSSLSLLPALKIVVITNNFLQGSFPEFPKGVTVDNLPDSNRFCLSSPGDCDSRVVNLLSIAKAIGYPSDLADSWKGNDPCKGWVAISCDPKGNITVINFENRGFSGTISPEFVKLSSLQKLLLSRNNLTGPIPPEITTLPSLAVLDVSNNLLSGKMPVFGENVVVITNGNPDLGKDIEQGSPSPERSNPNLSGLNAPSGSGFGGNGKKSTVSAGVVLGSVLAGVCGVCLLGLIGLLVYSKKTKGLRGTQGSNTVVIHPRLSGSDPDLLKITVAGSSVGNAVPSELTSQGSSGRGDIQVVEAGNMVISIQVLRNVTNNFSEKNILGQGGFGTVYKGELHDGTKIAVKRMEAGVIGGKALNEFTSEITVLTKVRHRHLVALLGYCLDGNEKLLVYEYMPQGALSRHLFSWKEEGAKPLDWKKRLTIALDVARGVEYLHNLAHQSFIHRDLKPSNILLGDDMRAKVADFGLVRLAPEGKCSVETRLAGTFGYLAPEYAVTGRLTIKADVFSFGVILMELISGRRALDETQPEESLHLVTWFRRMHLNKDTFRGAIDPSLELTEETLSSILTVAELAGHCCAREPYQRPDMSHAVSVLSPLVEQWKPTDPDEDDCYGIDLDMTLPQALKKWQAFEDTHVGVNSHSMASLDNTQTSIPTRPSGFADSFTSADAR